MWALDYDKNLTEEEKLELMHGENKPKLISFFVLLVVDHFVFLLIGSMYMYNTFNDFKWNLLIIKVNLGFGLVLSLASIIEFYSHHTFTLQVVSNSVMAALSIIILTLAQVY